VGAVGISQWINQSTICRVDVLDSTVVVDAISFGTSDVSFYIGGVGALGLYSWGLLGTSHSVVVTRSNVTLGPVTSAGLIFSVYSAAGVIADATPDVTPGQGIQAALINSTFTTGRVTCDTRAAMANFVLNGFGVIDIMHPARVITTLVMNSAVSVGAVVMGDYGYMVIAGVGAVLHCNVTAAVAAISVSNSSVRATTIGLRNEQYLAPSTG
jgi:hypothetical protein